nr:ABC transporter permease [uncultured Lichenicoccus sp.]
MTDRVLQGVSRVCLAGGFALTGLIYAPVVWLAILSVSGDPLSGYPGGWSLRWYGALAQDGSWTGPMLRSMGLATIVSALCVAIALPVGRSLPRLRRGRSLLAAGFLIPLGVPGTVMGLLLFTFYRVVLGVRMGNWSLVLAHVVLALPFALIGMLIAVSRFDIGLLDAAADLGASPWRRFLDIECPLLMPGIVSAALFGFLLSFTELPRSLFVAGPYQTLPLYIWAEASSRSGHVPLIFCLNTLITLVSASAAAFMVLSLGRTGPR